MPSSNDFSNVPFITSSYSDFTITTSVTNNTGTAAMSSSFTYHYPAYYDINMSSNYEINNYSSKEYSFEEYSSELKKLEELYKELFIRKNESSKNKNKSLQLEFDFEFDDD